MKFVKPYFRLVIEGTEMKTTTGYLDTYGRSDFTKGASDTFVFRNLRNVHTIKCITLKTESDDAVLLDWIEISSGQKNS